VVGGAATDDGHITKAGDDTAHDGLLRARGRVQDGEAGAAARGAQRVDDGGGGGAGAGLAGIGDHDGARDDIGAVEDEGGGAEVGAGLGGGPLTLGGAAHDDAMGQRRREGLHEAADVDVDGDGDEQGPRLRRRGGREGARGGDGVGGGGGDGAGAGHVRRVTRVGP
jgi:hypothetical protein